MPSAQPHLLFNMFNMQLQREVWCALNQYLKEKETAVTACTLCMGIFLSIHFNQHATKHTVRFRKWALSHMLLRVSKKASDP
jgi:hypothetical protein